MSAFASTNKNIINHPSSINRSKRPTHNERPQSSFVFGSSTPREISYINKAKVSLQDRLLIDIEPKRKPPPPIGDKDIIYYMRQARSIGPRGEFNKKMRKKEIFKRIRLQKGIKELCFWIFNTTLIIPLKQISQGTARL